MRGYSLWRNWCSFILKMSRLIKARRNQKLTEKKYKEKAEPQWQRFYVPNPDKNGLFLSDHLLTP